MAKRENIISYILVLLNYLKKFILLKQWTYLWYIYCFCALEIFYILLTLSELKVVL